jgi:glutamate receptor, ionotropic, plant
MYCSASHTGSGRLTFDSFAGPIIATGVASTSLVITLIIYFWKKKQCEAENCNSDPILRQEEIKERGDETFQWQEETLQTHGQRKRKKVMRNGSLVVHRGERISGPQVSSSARF